MFARTSSLQGKPERIDGAILQFNEEVLPAARKQPGFLGAELLVDRVSGSLVGTTYWEAVDSLKASEASMERARRKVAEALQSPIKPTVERYEVAIRTEVKQVALA